jgi:hypothetical protein
MVTNTNASLKVIGADGWVGAAVLRSQHTACANPESSCTSVIITGERRIPARVVSRLTADPLREVKQPAYNFELKCLLPLHGCATIDDIYPRWKQLPLESKSLQTAGPGLRHHSWHSLLGQHLADALDLRADSTKLFFNALIAAIDVVDAVDDGLAFGDQRG